MDVSRFIIVDSRLKSEGVLCLPKPRVPTFGRRVLRNSLTQQAEHVDRKGRIRNPNRIFVGKSLELWFVVKQRRSKKNIKRALGEVICGGGRSMVQDRVYWWPVVRIALKM